MTPTKPFLRDLKPGERSGFEVACPECGAPAGTLCRGLKILFGREQYVHGSRAANTTRPRAENGQSQATR